MARTSSVACVAVSPRTALREGLPGQMEGPQAPDHHQQDPMGRIGYMQILHLRCSLNPQLLDAGYYPKQASEKTCMTIGSTVHEIGHTIGQYHEHSRRDRDNYIQIDLNNVDPYNTPNFYIEPDAPTDISYNSIKVFISGDYEYLSIHSYL